MFAILRRFLLDSNTDSFAGKIDLILTKSISRFGRNTAETLDLLKRLRAANIDVYFEQEDMHSISTHNEVIIAILSGVAQEESRSRSENIKWGIQRSLERSDSKLYTRPCFGYRRDEKRSLSVFEPEAEIVREMYHLYLSGHSILSIIRELEKKEYKSPTGKNHWNKRTIDTILANEKYTGNVVAIKSFAYDYPNNNKRRPNHGEREKFLVEAVHPISRDIYDAVTLERQKRSNVETTPSGPRRKSTRYQSIAHIR